MAEEHDVPFLLWIDWRGYTVRRLKTFCYLFPYKISSNELALSELEVRRAALYKLTVGVVLILGDSEVASANELLPCLMPKAKNVSTGLGLGDVHEAEMVSSRLNRVFQTEEMLTSPALPGPCSLARKSLTSSVATPTSVI